MSVHINYGHSAREPEPDEKCMYCDKRDERMAYTYFGAAVCGKCWDEKWRAEEDGECDPPFADIKRRNSGEWLGAAPPQETPPCVECGRNLNGYIGPRCRYCDGTDESSV